MFKFFLIFCLLGITPTWGIDVIPVNKGDPAPDKGFFVDTENMNKFRKINEEKKVLEVEVIKLKDLNIVTEQRLDIYKDYSVSVEKELNKQKFKSELKGIGGFILGVVLTGIASYAAIKVSK